MAYLGLQGDVSGFRLNNDPDQKLSSVDCCLMLVLVQLLWMFMGYEPYLFVS